MSCFCEPRMTVMVTVSPTLCSWMLATSASDESIGLPSMAMTASCACRPAWAAGVPCETDWTSAAWRLLLPSVTVVSPAETPR